jgi:hypothetical protein
MLLRAAVSKPSSLTIVVNCATIISPFAARGERQSAPDYAAPRFSSADISSNREEFLIGHSIVPMFNGAMHPAEATGPRSEAWFVEADHVDAARRGRSGARVRREEATSLRAIIVSSLFLILFTGALLFGGHAAINPLLRLATTAGETRSVGDVLLPERDGRFCRHLSFDNNTATIAEGTVEPCPDNIAKGEFHSFGHGFSWGEH